MRRLAYWAILGTAALPLAAQAGADDYYATVANLIERVERLESRTSGSALSEMLGQTNQLRTELQGLRGDIEQLNHTLEQLQEQQRQQYMDLDQRIQALSGAAKAPPPAAKDNAAAPPPPSTDTADNEAAKQAYSKALDSLRSSHYAEAAAAFKRFLSDYPNDPQVSAARFWLAESYYVGRDLASAKDAYRKFIEAYPKHDKVPDALLHWAFSEYDSQKWSEASRLLKEISQRYPDSKAAAAAQQRLQKMKQEGH